MTAAGSAVVDDGRPRPAPPTLWQVDGADGQVVYRGPDLDLANDIYGGSPGGHLFVTRATPPQDASGAAAESR